MKYKIIALFFVVLAVIGAYFKYTTDSEKNNNLGPVSILDPAKDSDRSVFNPEISKDVIIEKEENTPGNNEMSKLEIQDALFQNKPFGKESTLVIPPPPENFNQQIISVKAVTLEDDLVKTNFHIDLDKEIFKHQYQDIEINYQTAGVIPTLSRKGIQWVLEDDTIKNASQDELRTHDLMIFNRHLIFDSFDNGKNLIDGQWYFSADSICPESSPHSLEYFMMSLFPGKRNKWYTGSVRFHGRAARSINYEGLDGKNTKFVEGSAYRCTPRGLLVNNRRDVNFWVQLSYNRLGILYGEKEFGANGLLFYKQPFLTGSLEGGYTGVAINNNGIIGEVSAQVKDGGKNITIKRSGSADYHFRGTQEIFLLKTQPLLYKADFFQGNIKGEGKCMSQFGSSYKYDTPMIYCISWFGKNTNKPIAFLLRGNFDEHSVYDGQLHGKLPHERK